MKRYTNRVQIRSGVSGSLYKTVRSWPLSALWLTLAAVSVHLGCDAIPSNGEGTPLGMFDPSRIDPVATILWTRLLGSTADDIARGVAVAPDGSIYVTGTTEGDIGGKTNSSSSGRDVFLAKYDATGTPLWVKLLG
ncbi:MAG: SBBP repeat-containing protein, partial [Phycisphaerae bacterium]